MDTPKSRSIDFLSRKSISKQKEKQNRKSASNMRKHNSKENILDFLSKNCKIRSKAENKIIREYLASTISFFAKLNNPIDIMKLEKLSAVLNYELYQKNHTIINYGEEGDKFYVLIEGRILITKPCYPQKTMLLNDYMNYMRKILYEEKNQLKYDRVIEKNHHIRFDMDLLFKAKSDSYLMKQEFVFFIEEEEKMGEYTEPFAFGDIALIKRAKRNATIRALKDCKMVTIEKNDYNKIIRELEEKRLEKQLTEFRKDVPLFMHWSLNNLIMLFNCFSNVTLAQGEYLYKQNEESDAIYIIKSGTFEMFSLMSFGWASEFFEYIVISKGNLAYFYKNMKTPLKDKDLYEYIDKKRFETGDSPCQFNPLRGNKVITSNQGIDNFEQIRNDQAEILDPCNLFKILVKRIHQNEVIGIEDSLELKKRYCFVKCISSNAFVEKVNMNNFYKLLSSIEEQGLDDLLDIISQKKAFLFKQLFNSTKQRSKILGRTFAFRCQNVINKEKPNEDTKLGTFSFRDNVFFDHTSMLQDIKSKVLSPSWRMSLKRKVKRSLIKEPSKTIFSPFINYKNSSIRHEKTYHDKLNSPSSKTLAFSIRSNLSNLSSVFNLRTIPVQFNTEKNMRCSLNKYSFAKKTVSTSILPTNPPSQKRLKFGNTSLSLKTEKSLPSKAMSVEHSKPFSNQNSIADLFLANRKKPFLSNFSQIFHIKKLSSHC